MSDDVVYDRVVLSVQERLEMIVCSFGLKSILEERGRSPPWVLRNRYPLLSIS